MKSVSLWEMRTIETIEEFYTRKFGGVPDDIRKEIGHFNVFKLDPFVGINAKPVLYARRDYFKIMLVVGNYKMHFADEVVESSLAQDSVLCHFVTEPTSLKRFLF